MSTSAGGSTGARDSPSTAAGGGVSGSDSPARRPRRTLRANPRVLLAGSLGLIVLLSLVRVITGADDITSGGTISAALALAVPIGLAGLGGLWAERAGVVNIGLEGMMILGTWGAAWAGYQYGPWAGVAMGVLMGAFGGLLHAVATVSFGVDHVVSGVAVNILGLGLTQFLAAVTFAGVPGGGETQSPPIASLPRVSVPGLSGALGDVQDGGVFLLADLAGVVRGLTTGLSLLTLLAIALVPLSYLLLWRTAFGLRLRSCGENPVAAESVGIDVYRMKYLAVLASGGLAGLGGAFLAIVASSQYREGQTAGRGFIGLAAMIFGNWRPGGLAGGSALFGYMDAAQLRRGSESVHALLLLAVFVLVVAAVLALIRARRRVALAALIGAALVLAGYLATDTVPEQITTYAPHITTLLVLSLAAQRLRMPAADGQPYRRGQGR